MGPTCTKNWVSMGHTQNKQKFFLTKADHKLSKTFYFIKISYVLTELWMFFYFVVMFFLLKRVISSCNSYEAGNYRTAHHHFTKICQERILSQNHKLKQKMIHWVTLMSFLLNIEDSWAEANERTDYQGITKFLYHWMICQPSKQQRQQAIRLQ